MNPSTILSVLTPLIGLRLTAIGRAADLLWLQFGELQEIPRRLGGVRLAGEWALHIQCPWQLFHRSAVLFSCEDLWGEIDGEEADVIGRFTHFFRAFDDRLKASFHRVDAVEINEVGGFSLRVSGGIDLEVLPDDGSDEQWRIFQPGDDSSHSVFPENLRTP